VLSKLIVGTLLTPNWIRLQGEEKGSAPIEVAFGPHPAAVAPNNPLHCRQPNAGPVKLVASVQALERTKELIGVGHIEASPIVSNDKCRHAVDLRRLESDPGVRTFRGKLPGVAQQVFQRDAQQLIVSFGH
jgi:hypothetical protein